MNIIIVFIEFFEKLNYNKYMIIEGNKSPIKIFDNIFIFFKKQLLN